MPTLISIVSLVGGAVAIVAGVLAIRRHFSPHEDPEIINPINQAETGGRYLTISARIPRPRRRASYWIAIQPNDCRGDAVWWAQNSPLVFQTNGTANLAGVRLGREGPDGSHDIGKTFTVGLFEVSGSAKTVFVEFAAKDERMPLPTECKLLHSVEVRRVYH